ncbi:MAG: hypothetical protein K2G13_09140, partial [Muribaculaceae bacterium]|nr:hypothetical protein [Muribaculaceae bacterium]
MWNLFKLTSFSWLLISTYCWVTALFNQGPILVVVNVIMIVCLSMMPIKIKFDYQIGITTVILILLSIWYVWIDGPVMGLITFLMYFPVLCLLQLPLEYKKELLQFSTKWYAILMIPALIIYWLSLLTTVPSVGLFVHPNYKPFINHIFYIETTFDYGHFVRFNAFFLEPGHQALLSTFMLIANRFRFRKCVWLWPLVLAVLFSFSLAGYLLLALGFVLLKIDNIWKGIAAGVVFTAIVIGAINLSDGNNAFYELIIQRLEKDDSQGIKGNNRYFNDTDFIYSKAVKKGDIWGGVKDKTNMDLVGGAGFKIFIINYGLIGVLLTLLFYLSVIPNHPDYRFTISFLIVIIL